MAQEPSSTFNPVRRRTFEDVATQIREQIAQGALREGDKLPPERALAEALGVSRNTVREALRSLEYAGLLAQRPGSAGGAFIANGGVDVIRSAFDGLMRMGSISAPDLIEARIMVGREVAFLACERYDEADFAGFVENVEATKRAAEAGDMRVRAQHSLAFHGLLAQATRNPVLVIMSTVLTDITQHFIRVIGAMPNEFVISSRERMLEHLRQRNGQHAADEMNNYLRTTLRTYLKDATLPSTTLAAR